MKFKLKKLSKLSGSKASFYTILCDKTDSLFGKFVRDNEKKFQGELLDILGRIKNMGTINGATDNFFKLDESEDRHDEKVVALYDKPNSRLRLYCVKLSDQLVVLCGGGHKPKGIIRWQAKADLAKEARLAMDISKLIEMNMEISKLSISSDGLHFIDNLELN